jgi:AraC-like DNA-binding protein
VNKMGCVPLRFDIRDVPMPSRRRALHQLREQGLLPIEPLEGCAPHVDLVKWRLSDISVLCGTFAGVRQGGEHGQAGDDELVFGINVSGHSVAGLRGREIAIGGGDAIAIAPDAGPFSLLRTTPARMIGIRVPRRSLSACAGWFGAAPMRLVPGQTPALRLMTGYVRDALSEHVLSSASLTDAVAAHLTELIALSLDPASATAPPASLSGVRAARLAAVKADIGRQLTDGTLSAAALAARHGISVRYLHKLFEDEELTYSQYVLSQRLALAFRRLRHPGFATRTVSSIASDAGFGDLSYFNRAFRLRYGITPSQARRFPPG